MRKLIILSTVWSLLGVTLFSCHNIDSDRDHLESYIQQKEYEATWPVAPIGLIGSDDGTGLITWSWTEGKNTESYIFRVYEGESAEGTAVTENTISAGTTSYLDVETDYKEDQTYTVVLTAVNEVSKSNSDVPVASTSTNITVNNIIDNAVFDRNGLFDVIFSDDKTCTINGFAAGKGAGITELVIPHYVIKDGDEDNPYLVTIIADGTVTGAGTGQSYSGAFSGKSWDKITLPLTLKVIGVGAFANCTVGSINFNELRDIECVKDGAFKLLRLDSEEVDLSASTKLTEIYNMAFYQLISSSTTVRTLKLPSTVEFIGCSAFWSGWVVPADAEVTGLNASLGWYTKWTSSTGFTTSSALIGIELSAAPDALESDILARVYPYTTRTPIYLDYAE